jgi:hypothetical protein
LHYPYHPLLQNLQKALFQCSILLFFRTLSKLFTTKYHHIPLNFHHDKKDKFLLPTESVSHTGIRRQCKSLLALETE